MPLVFEQIPVGGDRNFAYLLGDPVAKKCVLIDPSYSPEAVVKRAVVQGLSVTHIINTHGHSDHINGNVKAQALTHAPVAAHPDCPSMPDVSIADNSHLHVGGLRLELIYVPGHLDDHIAIFEATHQLLITGDLLFVGKVGGTDTDADARTQWASLQRVLSTFPAHATVWPGHDYGARPASTLALEVASNPFLAGKTLDSFLRMKAEWPEYKKLNGLL